MNEHIKNAYLHQLLGYSKILDKAFECPKGSPIERDLYNALCCKKSLTQFIYEITGLEKDYGFFKYGE